MVSSILVLLGRQWRKQRRCRGALCKIGYRQYGIQWIYMTRPSRTTFAKLNRAAGSLQKVHLSWCLCHHAAFPRGFPLEAPSILTLVLCDGPTVVNRQACLRLRGGWLHSQSHAHQCQVFVLQRYGQGLIVSEETCRAESRLSQNKPVVGGALDTHLSPETSQLRRRLLWPKRYVLDSLGCIEIS